MLLNLVSAAACILASVLAGVVTCIPAGGTPSTHPHPGHDLHEWTFVPASLATGAEAGETGGAGNPRSEI